MAGAHCFLEDGETSMKDYWLHMVMFKYWPLLSKRKNTRCMGELTPGLVQTGRFNLAHWRSRLYCRKLYWSRSRYGVRERSATPHCVIWLWKKTILSKLILVSNEFAFWKENRHPLTLYKQFAFPSHQYRWCRILRTNMTEQYVLLAKR
jgi:adenosine deaminase/adenosine deaminase CECR1